MKPTLTIGNAKVYLGNNLDIIPTLADNSVDSIVCDPPYGLNSNDYVAETIAKWIDGERDFIPDGKGFMGKSWDSFVPPPAIWDECLRVLKPGGHLLAFFGSRTQDIGALSIRLAGFEIRDSIAWIYGSGFPKSHNISKAIDRRAGAEREVLGRNPNSRENATKDNTLYESGTVGKTDYITAPATPEAIQWEGWGTALKPALEPIIVGRKPLSEKNVSLNVLKYGTGGINIDATRIGNEAITINTFDNGAKPFGDAVGEPFTSKESVGRFPANLILDEYTAELLDEQSNASRFFYVAKASKRDRNEGLENIEGKEISAKGNGLARTCDTCGATTLDGCDCPDRTFSNPVRRNFHPTVKPTALMQYLIKLVTPVGGTVLDPFCGSGSTGKAAILEGNKFIGIELTEEYLPIIEGRLKHAYLTLDDKEADLFE